MSTQNLVVSVLLIFAMTLLAIWYVYDIYFNIKYVYEETRNRKKGKEHLIQTALLKLYKDRVAVTEYTGFKEIADKILEIPVKAEAVDGYARTVEGIFFDDLLAIAELEVLLKQDADIECVEVQEQIARILKSLNDHYEQYLAKLARI